jgi:serine/threonine protein kinase
MTQPTPRPVPLTPRSKAAPRMPLTVAFARAVAVVAGLKVVVGLATVGIAVAFGVDGLSPRYALLAAHAIAFAASGVLLVAGGVRDRRAGLLGIAFLLVASVFADPLALSLGGHPHPLLAVARGVLALQVDAFTPYFVWRFVRAFPRVFRAPATDVWFRRATRVSLAAGVGLFAANALAASLSPEAAPRLSFLHYFSRNAAGGLYWPIQLGLIAVALPVLFQKTRQASLDERRRVALLTTGLVAGTLPTVLWVLLTHLLPSARAALPLGVAGWVVYPALLSTPFTTAYAVLVRHALDVRLVVRRALQYALARYSVLAATAVPLLLLAVSLYRSRDASIVDLVSTPTGAALAGLAALGLAARQWRGRILDRVDQRFFREQYDARAILGQLVDRCRMARDLPELTEVLRTEIDRALHPDVVHVLFLDRRTGTFTAPAGEVSPLRTDTALAGLLARYEEPIEVDLEHPSREIAGLLDAERHWLVDGDVRLLIPISDAERRPVGLLALGEKRSELPYSAEDRSLLRAAAGAAEMALAYHGLRAHDHSEALRDGTTPDERRATECRSSGTVHPSGVETCPECGAATVEATLPNTVGGKFVVERRIGAGGMGVVYRGVDLTLGRTVAIKTLPFVSPEEALRLRREARAMAAVTHEHLAMIYGAETWRGRPMLVVEYLGGGTLTDRLARGPFPADEAIDLGVALAAVLTAIHGVGVVHGDIKPSNIGFSTGGTPKLLDFGLARILTAAGGVAPTDAEEYSHSSLAHVAWYHHDADDPAGSSASRSVVFGTPRYMSPEALGGMPPSPADDLWSLCVVLYETIAGHHPFGEARATPVEPGPDGVPDVRRFAPTAPAALADLLHHALDVDRTRRPGTAAELRHLLSSLRVAGARPGSEGESLARAAPSGLDAWNVPSRAAGSHDP